MKKQKPTVANPSRALGFDAFRPRVLPSASSQGRLLWLCTTSWSRVRLGASLSRAVFYTSFEFALLRACGIGLLLFLAEAKQAHIVSPRTGESGHSRFVAE